MHMFSCFDRTEGGEPGFVAAGFRIEGLGMFRASGLGFRFGSGFRIYEAFEGPGQNELPLKQVPWFRVSSVPYTDLEQAQLCVACQHLYFGLKRSGYAQRRDTVDILPCLLFFVLLLLRSFFFLWPTAVVFFIIIVAFAVNVGIRAIAVAVALQTMTVTSVSSPVHVLPCFHSCYSCRNRGSRLTSFLLPLLV